MIQWEYRIHATALDPADLGTLWAHRGEDGVNPWSAIQQAGMEGWELVSTLPLLVRGETVGASWVFKRPREGP